MSKAKVTKPESSHIRVKLIEDRNNQEEMIVPKHSSMLIKKIKTENDISTPEYYVVTLLSNGYWKISADEYTRLVPILCNEIVNVKPNNGVINETK